jgi:hypothetical protein
VGPLKWVLDILNCVQPVSVLALPGVGLLISDGFPRFASYFSSRPTPQAVSIEVTICH